MGSYVEPDFNFPAIESVANGMLMILLVVLVVALALVVVAYVFQSISMYAIAKRRGIKRPWLAWIPYANAWMLGCISDQYQYVVKGQVKSRRKLLLTLCIINGAISLVSSLLSQLASAQILGLAQTGQGLFLVLSGCVSLASTAANIVYLVFWYIALYDLYRSCDPNNTVAFLVLSIIFSITQPFFMFACRNKDRGMPPRRPQPAAVPPQPTWQPQQPTPVLPAQPQQVPAENNSEM